jgi:kinesin family protein 2/24
MRVYISNFSTESQNKKKSYILCQIRSSYHSYSGSCGHLIIGLFFSMEIDGLKVGVNVDIQRTDGRIHSAVVSGVNVETRSVTVEWFERGETKGKEIEVEAIYSINPEFDPEKNLPKKRNADYEDDSIEGDTEIDSKTNRVEAKVARVHPKSNKSAVIEPPPAKDPPRNSKRPVTSQVPSSRARPSYARGSSNTVKKHEKQNQQQEHNQNGQSENIPEPVSEVPKKSAAAAVPTVPADDKEPPGGRRKSNCVKEVERIKQKREQRRLEQIVIKEQHEEEYDTSEPNWEFRRMISQYKKTLDFRPLTSSDQVSNHQITVCVRKRPMNKKEMNRSEIDVVTVPYKNSITVHEPKSKVDLTKFLENQQFRFDIAFDDTANNELVYRYTAKPLVECIFEGGMATCFAYGQTGSGKTHTMGGDFSARGQQDCSKGIYACSARDIFKLLTTKYKRMDLNVTASFFEIYSGKVFYLLNKKLKLRVLEDGKQQVQVVGLKEEPVHCVDDVLKLIQHGNHIRTSGTTSANNHSSRSHAVFQIVLKKK